MKKSILSILMVLSIFISLLPVGTAAAAESDPAGTIIIKNNNATLTDSTGFTASKTIEASYGTNGNHVQSAKTGYDGRNAVAVYYPGANVRWYIAPDAAVAAGTYDIYFYNVVNDGTDYFRDSTTTKAIPGYHTRYTVSTRVNSNTTNNARRTAETVYYVNQATASGSTDGWVKLGTHYFSGEQDVEYVELKNDLWNSYAYASAVKFVPVNRPDSAKLTHVYSAVNTTAAASVNDNVVTRILKEESTVTSNNIVMHIPKEYGAETTVSGGGTRRKIFFTLETEDPDAKIYSADMGLKNGENPCYYEQQYIEYGGERAKTFYVESENGKNLERYDISFVVEKNENAINLKVPTKTSDDTNFSIRQTNSSNSVGSATLNNTNTTNGWGAVDETWTGNAKLLTLGNYIRWTLKDTYKPVAGYYNVYLYPTFNPAIMGEYAEVIVDHAGIKEHKLVMPGKYHKATMQKVFAGTYYFDGSENQSVAVMNPSECLSGKQLCINGMQLVPAIGSAAAPDFDGVTVTSGENSYGITKDMIAGGGYVQPVEGTDATLTVVGSNSEYEYIKINGVEVSKNTASSFTLNEGANAMTLEIKLSGEEAKTYSFELYSTTSANSVSRRRGNSSDGYTEVIAPVSVNPWNTNIKAAYVSDASAAETANSFAFSSSLSEGYYKVLAYKPGFNHSVPSNSTGTVTKFSTTAMPYTVKTTNGNFTKTADWTGTDSRWTDLGSYYFGQDNTQGVTFGTVTGATPLLDTVMFLKLSDGVVIDGTFLELTKLEDKFIYTESSSVKIKHAISEDSEVLVNGTAIGAETETEINVSDGLNHFRMTVGDKEYNFAVIKTGSTVLWSDDAVEWVEKDAITGIDGYNGEGASLLNEADAIFNAPDCLNGTYEAYIYFVPVDSETLEYLSGEVSVTVTDAIGVTQTENITPTEEGWVKIGDGVSCTTESTKESIKISAEADNIAYISAVKFVSTESGLEVAQPVIDISTNNVYAWFYVYNGTESEPEVSTIVAAYDKTTKKLIKCEIAAKNAACGAGRLTTDTITVSDPENTVVKAFVWDSLNKLQPLTAFADNITK